MIPENYLINFNGCSWASKRDKSEVINKNCMNEIKMIFCFHTIFFNSSLRKERSPHTLVNLLIKYVCNCLIISLVLLKYWLPFNLYPFHVKYLLFNYILFCLYDIKHVIFCFIFFILMDIKSHEWNKQTNCTILFYYMFLFIFCDDYTCTSS